MAEVYVHFPLFAFFFKLLPYVLRSQIGRREVAEAVDGRGSIQRKE